MLCPEQQFEALALSFRNAKKSRPFPGTRSPSKLAPIRTAIMHGLENAVLDVPHRPTADSPSQKSPATDEIIEPYPTPTPPHHDNTTASNDDAFT